MVDIQAYVLAGDVRGYIIANTVELSVELCLRPRTKADLANAFVPSWKA